MLEGWIVAMAEAAEDEEQIAANILAALKPATDARDGRASADGMLICYSDRGGMATEPDVVRYGPPLGGQRFIDTQWSSSKRYPLTPGQSCERDLSARLRRAAREGT